MRLIPLEQWVCDSCGGVIEKPGDGWFEWISEKEDVDSSFKIVHHSRSCMYNEQDLRQQGKLVADLKLTDVIGKDGLANSLFRIELSEKGMQRINLIEFVEVLRRLHVPYWEEARQYWDRARQDGFHDGCDFGENSLLSIIKGYGEQE